ncbi:ATP-dependent helicase HepA [bacterium BMS3Abin06]|nr:ATP-dependent helicase HepA [bacterium BMS3Abin06]
MSTHFITNQEKLLSDVVKNILPSSEKLYFLIGYFYFSGFQELHKHVVDKETKILVGLDIEHDLTNKIREYEIIQEVHSARGKIREIYYKSLVDIFNDTDFFDSEEKQDAFRLFLDKIKDGSLEIRKTLQPNHAKLYIFENREEFSQGGEYPGTVITGSSNFTRAGMKGRFEINVISRDARNYEEAYKIFESLWKESVTIVDKNNIDEFLYNVVEKIWIDKLPRPFLLYVRVLEEYFSERIKEHIRLPVEITRGRYFDLKYQVDAIKKALDVIQRHNGVIIADVVGLGKSIIASAVAHNLNLRTIIITPPHLIGQWDDYRYEFDINARIYSSGKIQQALKENNQDEEKVLIIDEAHKYRNELTADYADLHKLCQKNKVILLSATPFNNRPQDVFSMVKFFQIPSRSTIQTVDNLSFQFRRLILEYKKIKDIRSAKKESGNAVRARIKNVADGIRNILSPLVIRRSRLDLDEIEEYKEDLKQQKIEFPKVNDPQILEYDLSDLGDLYEETLDKIAPEDEDAGFIGARYKPTCYIKNFEKYRKKIAKDMGVDENLLKQSQINLSIFMKRLLVRRFESSIHAFRLTLDSIIRNSERICEWYEKLGRIPVYKKGKLPDLDSLMEATGEDLDEELKDSILEHELKDHIEKGLWLIDKKELKKKFIEDIRKDIRILSEIRSDWFGAGFPDDPKLERFTEIIRGQLRTDPGRKIIVFSEFSDTTDYLYDNLKEELKVFKYTGGEATKKNKQIIRENFDAGYRDQKDDYDLLIATDAISEGFNLHRAGTVFNYDIPYNPTRVIQRVGRINRINMKVFNELFIYNFFPTSTGERETRVRQISTLKIAMVHALFGEDTKVLTKDEELQSWFAKQFQETFSNQEELSPETKYENFIKKLRVSGPGIIDEAMNISRRSRIRRRVEKDRSGVIVFGKKGEEYVFKYGSKKGESISIGVAEALRLFEADMPEEAKKTSDSFGPIYDDIKKNLFARKTEVSMDRGKTEAIQKVEALKGKLPTKRDYLEDLLYVVRDLDALPDRYAKLIRAIDIKTLKEDMKELEKEVPHKYLIDIIDREKKIDEGREVLILSEELI